MKTKKASRIGKPSEFIHTMLLIYAGNDIASDGQTSAHVPHSVQASGLIEYLSPSEIAPAGHSSIQVPHAIQSSPIT